MIFEKYDINILIFSHAVNQELLFRNSPHNDGAECIKNIKYLKYFNYRMKFIENILSLFLIYMRKEKLYKMQNPTYQKSMHNFL